MLYTLAALSTLLAPTSALQLGAVRCNSVSARACAPSMLDVSPDSHLAQLAGMTTLSIDTGDLDILEEFGATGLITDATTNPLFVSQAGLSGDARYIAFVDAAIAYAKAEGGSAEEILELSMDRLAVELGLEIVKLVPGYVSTEVDIRASFDTVESLRRGARACHQRDHMQSRVSHTWDLSTTPHTPLAAASHPWASSSCRKDWLDSPAAQPGASSPCTKPPACRARASSSSWRARGRASRPPRSSKRKVKWPVLLASAAWPLWSRFRIYS